MKIFITLLTVMTITGCATIYPPDVHHTQQDGVYVLTLMTGTAGENLYTSNFKSKASDLCPAGYDVLDKSRVQYTKTLYKWVVKCHD